ncbi:phosphotransferase [Streptomyces sp. NPDC008313]|uniref:phosphotransferase n=1 Tax=Streptomyces sp. NPDC008313 TaxID=3364826 RepID=UPI0036E40D88
MPARLIHRAYRTLVLRLVHSRRRRFCDEVIRGHHNVNHVLPLGVGLALLVGAAPFARAKLREPLDTVEVVPRIWPREGDVLRVVSRYLREAPACLVDFGSLSLHSFRPGKVLSEAPFSPVGEELMDSFAQFFARTTQVPVGALPPRPDDWPDDGDSDGFLRWLARFHQERVHRANLRRFGTLFDALRIPEDALEDFAQRHRGLTPRPFRLLHTDVHRANALVDKGRLVVIDWELAILGDPVHDLATHLVRMRYDKHERQRMKELWVRAMTRSGQRELTAGIDDDLRVYTDFEYAQSVFADVMRVAIGLPERPDEEQFHRAGRRIQTAIGLAREPLRLMEVLDLEGAVKALRVWHDQDVTTRAEDGDRGRG